jgi:hypothetical protein
MLIEPEINDEQDVRLKDVTEEGAAPTGTRTRGVRKKLSTAGALCALTIFAATTGYFLLRGKELRVDASRKAVEKITSGSDLQKAAYDSLSGSLKGPTPDLSPTAPAANTGLGQPAKDSTAGANLSSATEDERSPKIATQAQPGIAATLAPPAEAALSAESKMTALGRTATGYNRTDATSGGYGESFAAEKPKRGASISFSVPLAPAVAPEMVRPKPINADLAKTPILPGEPYEMNSGKPGLEKARTTPGFGAMLPVRLMGALYTLRQGALARLELTRDIKNERWALKRGTIFIGVLLGSELDRAFIQIKGYIDPETNVFTKLDGELLGSDGGAGMRGRQRRVTPVWTRILDRAAQAGTQILSSVLGRNSSVIVATDPYGTLRTIPGSDQSQSNRVFVEVPAGTVGFVLITSLPVSGSADSHLVNSDFQDKGNPGELSEAELAELFTEADPERIKSALPRLSPELRPVAEAVLREIETPNNLKGR